ncbi:hypothetical protein ILUMI_04098, partial [Ignelater luminosus]
MATCAPTDDCPRLTKDEDYDNLTDIVDESSQKEEIMLTGNMNARVGSMTDYQVVGQFGKNNINISGELLIEYCTQHSLEILNGFNKHKLIHRYTWKRPRPSFGQKSIIDYFTTKQKTKFKWQDCRVKRGPNCGSDHYLVEADNTHDV